jgi:hypothetical protein
MITLSMAARCSLRLAHAVTDTRFHMMKRITLLAAVLSMTGCASVTIPPEKIEQSQASIRGAEEMGALGVPSARLHLELAKDQTATAKQMALNGDERAELVLARANADAELALGLAREVSVHTEALKADEDLRAVQARGTP